MIKKYFHNKINNYISKRIYLQIFYKLISTNLIKIKVKRKMIVWKNIFHFNYSIKYDECLIYFIAFIYKYIYIIHKRLYKFPEI
jgi:hypothetical protein